MKYIVASASKPDYEFETYEEACEWAQYMRREGVDAAIVNSDDHWHIWSVCKTGMTTPLVVGARSADEALVIARSMTNDYNLDTVQCR